MNSHKKYICNLFAAKYILVQSWSRKKILFDKLKMFFALIKYLNCHGLDQILIISLLYEINSERINNNCEFLITPIEAKKFKSPFVE